MCNLQNFSFILFHFIYLFIRPHGVLVAVCRVAPEVGGILVPQPGIEPEFSALEGRFFTTGPPGKAPFHSLLLSTRYKPGAALGSGNIMVGDTVPASGYQIDILRVEKKCDSCLPPAPGTESLKLW